jgi:hypothetical protein
MNLQENCLRKETLDSSGRLLWNYRYRTKKNMLFNRVNRKCRLKEVFGKGDNFIGYT